MHFFFAFNPTSQSRYHVTSHQKIYRTAPARHPCPVSFLFFTPPSSFFSPPAGATGAVLVFFLSSGEGASVFLDDCGHRKVNNNSRRQTDQKIKPWLLVFVARRQDRRGHQAYRRE